MRRGVWALVAVAALLTACGGGVEGSAVAGERWDPCSITPEIIEAAGLDPAYRDEGWGEALSVAGWARCEYMPPGAHAPYALSVMSSNDHTVAEARTRSANKEGRDLEVGGRTAYLYKTEFGAAIRDCNMALEVPPGVAVFTVLYQEDDGVDACGVLQEHMRNLVAAVPSGSK